MSITSAGIKTVASFIPPVVKDTVSIRLWALAKVPMLAWIRPQVVHLDDTKTVVKIPLNRRTKNHLNSMYFGTLACGADIAGALIAFRHIQKSGQKVSLVFKDFKAEFLKRPEADTVFTCEGGKAVEELVEQAIKTGERVSEKVYVIATCPSKFGAEPVAKFELTLSLKKGKS
jgi:acyl-coenzyme A thioesterase PaaI-like protein